MSTESTDDFEEIDGLDETTEAVNSALEQAEQLETSLSNALNQLSVKQNELNESQLEQIRTSFEQSLEDDWRTLESATEEYKPGGFEDQVENILDDFNSILQRPEAESVIEELEEWLVENGTEPFDDGERDDLVDIAENKIESARDVLSELRASADEVLARLESHDDRFLQLIHEEITEVSTVGGMRNLSNDLATIDSDWLYPWSLDSDDESVNQIRSTVDDMLYSQMEDIITDGETLGEVSTLVSERFDGVEDILLQLEEDANRIASLHSSLKDSDFSEVADVALARLERRLKRAERLNELSTALDESIDDIETLKHLTEADLQRFERGGYDVSADLQQPVETAETKANEAADIREEVFTEESDEDFTEVRGQFDKAVSEADDALDTISSRIKHHILTSEQLAETFDLTEYSGSLNELKLNAERADQLDELLEIADEHRGIRVEIRNDIQEEIDEDLGALLEWALGREETTPIQNEEIEKEAKRHNMARAEVIDGLLELQEKGLIELTIRGA
jgi:ABC-type transporter Mla subunit MlaD